MFDKDGFEILRGFVETTPIESAIAALQMVGLTGRAINYTGSQVNSIHGLKDDFFEELLHSDKMVEVATSYLGEQAVPRAAEFFAKPAKVGLASPWHQDNAYWCLEPASGLTIWIALDGSDWLNGAVSYLRGSHRFGLFPHQPSFAPGSSQVVEVPLVPAFDYVIPALEPGWAVVHHCLTIHGSAPNISGRSRRGVTLQYQGLSAHVNAMQRRAYEDSLHEQIRGRA